MGDKIKFKYPDNLNPEVKKFITDVINKLEEIGELERVDLASITMLAENYNLFINVMKELKKSGLTITSDRGNISINPLVKIWKDSQLLCQSIMDSYGLTMKSRKKLGKDDDPEDDSPLMKFMKEES